MKVCINYDILRQFRTDKYVNWIIKQSLVIKPSDMNILFANESYLTVAERCYMFLIKSLPPSHAHPSTNSNSIELILPSSLYKIQRGGFGDHEPFDCYLREYYELPHIEVLNDWIVLLESSLNTLYTPESHQNLLIEAYIIQMVLAFFGERDGENQLSLSILEKINALANNSPVTSPELTVAIHTWSGILSETKLFTQCEQSYAIALMALHKLNGDPRGRGGKGTPWELFISWRLSILFRLQGKSHDAEYSEEMYDATLLTLQDNPMNTHLKSHYIYDDPLRAYTYSHSNSNQAEISHLVNKPNMRNLQAKAHPFPHWTNHLMFDETCSKIDTLNLTLQKTPQLLKWMLAYIPTSQPSSGILWDTENLRDFFLLVMQDSFNNTSVSSVSNYSTERGRDRSSLDMSQGMKISNLKVDKKERKLNLGGNFVRIFEKDTSTFNKKEINGTVYTWGQNEKGQMGTHPGNIEEIGITTKKKTRIFYPKRLITLKDTIIVSVACGSFHSMAITLNGQLLAWGDNRFSQLGLGSIAPAEVFTPTLVSNLIDVSKVNEYYRGYFHRYSRSHVATSIQWLLQEKVMYIPGVMEKKDCLGMRITRFNRFQRE